MEIRNATIADLPGILEIYNDAILNTTAVYSEVPHTLEMRQTWYNDRVAAGFPVFVADAGGSVAGFSTYGSFRVWPCYSKTIEHSVYVHAGFRGQGLSKLLIQPLIDHARGKGMHVMIAGVDADNPVSLNLHRSLGFTEVAHFKEVGYKFGRWLDLKFLQLFIDK
ncbi:MAG: N-acetyltransferase family protein [Mucilaginibacter sp.]